MHILFFNSLGIRLGVPCGRPEWVKFQQALGSEYQLHIISKDFHNSIVYQGSQEAENKLYIYHADNHYNVITSMPAFHGSAYYCHTCHVGYNKPFGHTCKTMCKACHAKPACTVVQRIHCKECRRSFASPECYQRHLTIGICKFVKGCDTCGKVFHVYQKHSCGMKYCKLCKENKLEGHQCYIKPLKENERTKVSNFIFYDFECMLIDNQHVPNLCVLQKVCSSCIELPLTETCGNEECQREQVIFGGQNTLKDVGDWLFSGRNKNCTCIAHNSSSYDGHLIMNYVHERGFKPTLIENGKKILSMEVKGLRFIDSLNFFSTGLANLPKMFGLTELSKGWFPHLFNRVENQTYVGAMPDVKFYDPDGMKEDKRAEFLAWYNTQTRFHFQNNLEKYCISDVDVLRMACGRFRSLFLENTGGIEPFQSCTIASACNRVYRTNFLQPEQIGIIPTHGYVKDNQSVLAMCWLDWIAAKEHRQIRHAYSHGGEATVEGVKVDGLDINDGTIYQLQGCFHHGCKNHFRGDVINPFNGLTMQELYDKTMTTTAKLRNAGHTVIEKWGCEFRQ